MFIYVYFYDLLIRGSEKRWESVPACEITDIILTLELNVVAQVKIIHGAAARSDIAGDFRVRWNTGVEYACCLRTANFVTTKQTSYYKTWTVTTLYAINVNSWWLDSKNQVNLLIKFE